MTEDPARPALPPYDPENVPTLQDDLVGARPVAGSTAPSDSERDMAVARLHQKRAFGVHLTVYGLVMTLLVVIWLLTEGWGGYFWPIWPALGWGLGVGIHAASLYWDREPTDEEIRLEAERLRRKRLG